MTKKEAAIISAFTGIPFGDQKTFMDYVSKKMGREVEPHEIPGLSATIKGVARMDFLELSENLTD